MEARETPAIVTQALLVPGARGVLRKRRVMQQVERGERGACRDQLLVLDAVPVQERILLVDGQVVQRERQVPFGRRRRDGVLPVDDRADAAGAVVDEDVLQSQVAVIQARLTTVAELQSRPTRHCCRSA